MRMILRATLLFLGAMLYWLPSLAQQSAPAPRPWNQNPNGMHVYLQAGLKTHQVGQHDYPQFLADWSKILTEHGAIVDGSLHAPARAELEDTDVLVIYKGDDGYMSDSARSALEAFVKRGGGIVSLHDSLCGPDPAYFATLVGGAKKHGEVNYTLGADIPYTIVDKSNPIMQGMSDITIFDEAFFNMTWAKDPAIHVLATAVIPGTPSAGTHKGEVVPQIWTYEHTLPGGQPARAFVWMQGHTYANFANPQIQAMLLRGIAWAGKRPVDELVDYKPRCARQRALMELAIACEDFAVSSSLALLAGLAANAQTSHWPTQDGNYVIRNFHFGSGESIPELKLHYLTLGKPHRDAAGHTDNAVLLLHGTGGDAHSLLNPVFSDVLFGPGQPLDITKFYIILPDDIGHGESSKPSDGLRMHFPQYDYDDMVASQHTMLVDGLHVDHLRLILGTSMGCMQSFVWGETYPRFLRCAGALRLPAGGACRPQPLVAIHGDADHPRRSCLEERRLHHGARRGPARRQ